MKERIVGAVILLWGAGLGYLCIYQPLESAWSGAPKVTVSLKGAVLVPVGLVGLIYLILGPRAYTVMGTRDKPTPASYAIWIGALLMGIGLYFWLKSTLQTYGYDFQGRI